MNTSVRRWAMGIALLTGFGGSLAVWPPAYWVTDRLAQMTGERLAFAAVQGSLWRGDAQLVLFDGNQRRAIPGRLVWQIHPLAFAGKGQVVMRIEHPGFTAPVTVTPTDSGFAISAGQLQFPAAWLEATGTPWNTLRPGGSIQLGWGPVTVGRAFSVTIRWQDAQSALSMVKPLGNYEALVNFAEDGAMSARLNTLSGDLRLEGQASWSASQGFGFSGYASASPTQQVALTGLLSQMGRLENNRYRLGS